MLSRDGTFPVLATYCIRTNSPHRQIHKDVLWAASHTYALCIVQSLSCVWLFVTLWTSAYQASLSFTISLSLLKVMFIELVMPPNHLILCHPVLLLPSIFPSIRIFYNESALLIKWTKYWSFSFSISPSNEYSELISFRINWLDLLAVLGTLKSLLQHPTPKIHMSNFNLQCVGVWRRGFCEVIGYGWSLGGEVQMMGSMPL